jgi:hypothetical protein
MKGTGYAELARVRPWGGPAPSPVPWGKRRETGAGYGRTARTFHDTRCAPR